MSSRFVNRLLLITLITVLLAGCSFSNAPPSISSVSLTDQVDATSKAPKNTLTDFPPATAVMYVSAQVQNSRKGTMVTAKWFYDKDGNGRYEPIDSADVTFDAASRNRYAAFSLEAAKPPFPSGAYQVQLFLDDKQVKELNFKVLQ